MRKYHFLAAGLAIFAVVLTVEALTDSRTVAGVALAVAIVGFVGIVLGGFGGAEG